MDRLTKYCFENFKLKVAVFRGHLRYSILKISHKNFIRKIFIAGVCDNGWLLFFVEYFHYREYFHYSQALGTQNSLGKFVSFAMKYVHEIPMFIMRVNCDFVNSKVQEIGWYRSSHRRCSVKKDVLRNFAKFTGKHLCQRLFFNSLAGLRPATLLKKSLLHKSLWH